MSGEWTSVDVVGKRLQVKHETAETLQGLGVASDVRKAWTFTDRNGSRGHLILMTDQAVIIIRDHDHDSFPLEEVELVTESGIVVNGKQRVRGEFLPSTVAALRREIPVAEMAGGVSDLGDEREGPPPKARWYEDPEDYSRARYWDGNQWTNATRRKDRTALTVAGILFGLSLLPVIGQAVSNLQRQGAQVDVASGLIDLMITLFIQLVLWGLIPYGITYAITVRTFPRDYVAESLPADTKQPPRAAPAGWYEDSTNPLRQRFWDGKQWTKAFRPNGDATEPPTSQGGRGPTPQ